MTDPPQELVPLSVARRLLEQAECVHDVKKIRDVAEAARVYAKQAVDGLDMQNEASEVKLRAERKAGELLAGMTMHDGNPRSHDATRLRDLGITKSQSSRWQCEAGLPDPAFQRYVAETKAAGRELTSSGLLKLAKRYAARHGPMAEPLDVPVDGRVVTDLGELAGERFRTIYADPPWEFQNCVSHGAAAAHYRTIPTDELCDPVLWPVESLADDDCQLHLWVPNSLLPDGLKVLASWGFSYRTNFAWVKPTYGAGNFWRTAHEMLLLGARGNAVFIDKSLGSWGEYSRGDHSRKPDAVRMLIERAFRPPRLELFGRQAVPGWVVFGDQVAAATPPKEMDRPRHEREHDAGDESAPAARRGAA